MRCRTTGGLADAVDPWLCVRPVLVLDPQFSIDLQLIGGVLILQTLPAIVFGLLTPWFHAWGVLLGWAVGLVTGLVMLYNTPNPLTGKTHLGGAQVRAVALRVRHKAHDAPARVRVRTPARVSEPACRVTPPSNGCRCR